MNVKVFATVSTIVLLNMTPVLASDIPLGCMSKPELNKIFKEHNQSFLEQFTRNTAKGEVKTSVTGEHDGKSYVSSGTGYIVDATSDQACVVAKTRLDAGQGTNEVIVSSLHEIAGGEYTAAEIEKIANTALKDPDKRKAQWKAEGIDDARAESWLEAFRVMQRNKGLPGQISIRMVYKIQPDRVVPVSKEGI